MTRSNRRPRGVTMTGRSGLISDWSMAWNSISGDELLICLEDDDGHLVGWYRPEGLAPAGQVTLFDSLADSSRTEAVEGG